MRIACSRRPRSRRLTSALPPRWLCWLLAVGWFRLPVIQYAEAHPDAADSIWRHRRLVLGAAAIFVYVGAEVAIGSLMTNYFSQKEIGNMSLASAAGYLQFYWGGAMVGRFVGSALLQRLRTQKLLA